MREKYESLSAAVLRELAKARGMKGISTLKKAELVEAMLAEDEKEAKVQEAKKEAEGTTETTDIHRMSIFRKKMKRSVWQKKTRT